MSSRSFESFLGNKQDVDRLLEIHTDYGGSGKGRRYRLEVLNKSAIVLITAIWEAFCEDLAAEALDHMVSNITSGAALPKVLKKQIADEIKKNRNELAMWDLADTGWRTLTKQRLSKLTSDRNTSMNTPKGTNIDALFENAIGLPEVSKSWRWQGMTAIQAKRKLDTFVVLRGAIAHRGTSASGVKKASVIEYLAHVSSLVDKTDVCVNNHCRSTTGKSLW